MTQSINCIKYEGDNSTFVWKHPDIEFDNQLQLIVREGQEAVVFFNGKILGLFEAGNYSLSDIRSKADETSALGEVFHLEVFFVNKTMQMGLKWGTDTRVRYIEQVHGIPVELGASGEMSLQVLDSKRVFEKLLGFASNISWDETGTAFTKSLQNSFKPFIGATVKTHLSRVIKELEINILEIDEHLESISEKLKGYIQPTFEEYGLAIPEFFLSRVILPEDDANFKRLRSLYSVGIKKESARAEAEVTRAEREVEIEKQITKTEIAKREAERKILVAKADAEVSKIVSEAKVITGRDDTNLEAKEKDNYKTEENGFKIWHNPNAKNLKTYKSKIKES